MLRANKVQEIKGAKAWCWEYIGYILRLMSYYNDNSSFLLKTSYVSGTDCGDSFTWAFFTDLSSFYRFHFSVDESEVQIC